LQSGERRWPGRTNVPELGDDEEVLPLDDAFFDGSSDALARFNLVAVVWYFVR
jgi:hypothetical protein